jgi:hypothetical protein
MYLHRCTSVPSSRETNSHEVYCSIACWGVESWSAGAATDHVPVRAIPRPTPVHLHAKCSSFRAVSFLDIARTGDTRNTYWIPVGNKDSEDGKLYWWVTLRGLRLLDCILSVVPSIKGIQFREFGFVAIIRWTGCNGNLKFCTFYLGVTLPTSS